MEQNNKTYLGIEIPEIKSNQYSIDYLKITAPSLKFSIVLGVIASILVFFSACKKDDDKVDEKLSYGTIALLKEGGQQPLWSPNGEKIAYQEDGKLYVMNTDGSEILLLTSLNLETIEWSPTGTELAYLDFRDGSLAIYKIGVGGSNEVELTGAGLSLSPFGFSWSPDGEKIVYGVSGLTKIDMYIMNKDGTDNHKVDIPKNVKSPSYTPGGSRIMFISTDPEWDLYLVGTDGSNLQRLESPEISVGDAEMKGDESKIYFSGSSGMNWDIYEVNPDGSNIKNLTNGVGNNQKPHLSPDGKYIAFLRDGVYIIHADGSNPSKITKGDFHVFPGSWSPDSRKLVFYDEVDGVQGIYVLTLK